MATDPAKCRFDVLDVIREYTELGWAKTSRKFLARSESAKRSGTSSDKNAVDNSLMDLLGAVRICIVGKLYDCSRTSRDQVIKVLGSTNPTSDYDATLMGPGAADTMWRMFGSYLNSTGGKTVLPVAFDVNLYTTGMYVAEGARECEALVRFSMPDEPEMCTYTPRSVVDRAGQVTWAAIKMVEQGVRFPDPGVHARAQARIDALQGLRADVRAAVAAYCVGSAYTDDTLDYLAMYALQYHFSRQFTALTNHGYRPDEPGTAVPAYGDMMLEVAALAEAAVQGQAERSPDGDRLSATAYERYGMSLFDLLSHARYFAIEGAYVQGTVNVVVIEGQGGVAEWRGSANRLDGNDYLCTIVENCGDFVNHCSHDVEITDVEAAVKYSKYVHRMFQAADRLGLRAFAAAGQRFAAEVYPLRGNLSLATEAVLHPEMYSAGTPDAAGVPMTRPQLVAAVAGLFDEIWRAASGDDTRPVTVAEYESPATRWRPPRFL